MINPCVPEQFQNMWLVLGEWTLFMFVGYISFKFYKDIFYPLALWIVPIGILFDILILKYPIDLSILINTFILIFIFIGWFIGIYFHIRKTKTLVFVYKKWNFPYIHKNRNRKV